MKEHLHGGPPETADIESLRNEVSDLRQKVELLTAENSELKQRVSLKSMSNERFIVRVPFAPVNHMQTLLNQWLHFLPLSIILADISRDCAGGGLQPPPK